MNNSSQGVKTPTNNGNCSNTQTSNNNYYNDNYSNINANKKTTKNNTVQNNQQAFNNNHRPPNAPPPPNSYRPPNTPPPNNGYRPPNAPPPPNNNPYYQQSQYATPPVKTPKRIYDKADKVFGWFAVVIGFLFVLTIGSLWFDFGIGATIFFEVSLVISYCYAIKRKIKIGILHNISFFLLMILSLSFSFFSNSLALGADFLFITLAFAHWIYSIGKNKEESLINELFTSVFVYPFMNFGALFGAISKKKKSTQKGNLKWVILGLCIAIPLVCIVSTLLIMSDDMFKAMFSSLFDDFLLKIFKYLWYTIVGLPLAMALFSAWYTKYTEDNTVKAPTVNATNSTKQRKPIDSYQIAPPALMYSILIPLCCVYFLYLISQIGYFVSFIADNLLPKDYTIVDYARNGFFELCVVAGINIVLIVFLLLFTNRPNNIMPIGVRVITVLMSFFTVIFIGTALYKMFMYIGGYGFTPLRINTVIFMSFLLVVFALIIIKQFFKGMKFSATVMVAAIIFMLGYNLIDVDSFVARNNIKLYEENKIPWMGMELVYDLDYSALEYLAPFASDEDNGLDETENQLLDQELRERYSEYSKSYSIDSHKDLFSFNFNEYRVHRILESYGYDDIEWEYSYSEYEYVY